MSILGAKDPPSITENIVRVAKLLELEYGRPESYSLGDPLDGLVLAILSQNTNDRNRDLAFNRLKTSFSSWDEVLKAGPKALEKQIRVGGLAPTKSKRIIQLLEGLREKRGRVSLDYLHSMGSKEAEEELLSLVGVGKKTARCVLLFELGYPVFPVDTHIFRISRRLDWIGDGISRERAQDLLQALVPPEYTLSLHLNLIRHGRVICRAKRPRCNACCLAVMCHSFSEEVKR